MDSLTKALHLAKLGIYTFPTDPRTKQPYPGTHGHLDASADAEELSVWFSVDHPDAVVGIHAGKSELVFLDIDVDATRDGYSDLGFLDIPDTFNYPTRSGDGRHYWYDLSDSKSLPPKNSYRGMQGVDRKSGSSYVIFWGDELPQSRDDFAMPPAWLLDMPEAQHEVSGYDGDVDGWLDSIPQGEPTDTVAKIIRELPTDNFNHQTVISVTYRLVRLAAEGHTGVGWALDEVYRNWVKPPYDGPEERKELANAIIGAIRKAGDEDKELKSIAPYGDVIDKASSKLFDKLTGAPNGKSVYFDAISVAVSDGLSDDDIVSLVWSGPSTKAFARDWGIDYLHTSIAAARKREEERSGLGVLPPDEDESNYVDNVELLTPQERVSIAHEKTFIDRYCEIAASRVKRQNLPYDLLNAWIVLSLALSGKAYVPSADGPINLNLFGNVVGESTSGKSESRKWLKGVAAEVFAHDKGFDIGGNPSPQALGKALLERDKKVSFFNKDEAHGAMKGWMKPESFQSGLTEALADLYEGRVDAQLRTSDWDASKKSATTYFVMHLQGTPDEMFNILNRDMFASGFLVRFLWAVGEPSVLSYDSMAFKRGSTDFENLGFDPQARQLAAELNDIIRNLQMSTNNNTRIPVDITDEAAKRVQDAMWKAIKIFENDSNFDILKPSLLRLNIMAYKCSAMLALSAGRDVITLYDVLLTLEHMERWLNTLAFVVSKVTASEFQRSCDEVLAFIRSRPHGEERRERVLRRFKHIETRIVEQYIQSLISQGYLREFNGTGGSKMLGVRGIDE